MSGRFGLQPHGDAAPGRTTREWFNAPHGLDLAALCERLVVLHTFQRLCPACEQHGLSQTQRLHESVAPEGVAVIGLHTVFEHHAALAAFLHEWRIRFPVDVDPHADDAHPVPRTMQACGLWGAPSPVLIDRAGHLRCHRFGADDDLSVGAAIATLLAEPD